MLPEWLTGVEVGEERVPAALNGAAASGVLWQAAPGRFLLDAPGVARYHVAEGRRVSIDVAPGASMAEVTRFLRLTPFAALLFQRRIVALHAATAVPPGEATGAIVIAGDSSAGKSTLLAGLIKRGWLMLADEVTAIDVSADGVPMAWPTFPDVRLWRDARERLEVDDVSGPMAPGPMPVRLVVALSQHNREGVRCSERTGRDRFQALSNCAYNPPVASVLLDARARLRQLGAVARVAPFYSIERPRGVWSGDELADRVHGMV